MTKPRTNPRMGPRWMGALALVATATACANDPEVACDPIVPESLIVVPANRSVVEGESLQFAAQALYCDGRSEWVTQTVEWSTSDPDVAAVDADGVGVALAKGPVAVTGRWEGFEKAVRLLVTPRLEHVELALDADVRGPDGDPQAPHELSLAAGTGARVLATGVYRDHSKRDLTATVAWADTAAFDVGPGGTLTATQAGTALVEATLGAVVARPVEVTVSDAAATELAIEGAPESILPAGESIRLTAVAGFDDGTRQPLARRVTWEVAGWGEDDDPWAEIDAGGRLTGLAEGGPVTVTARWQQHADEEQHTASVEVTVEERALGAVAIVDKSAATLLPVRIGPAVLSVSERLPVEPLRLRAEATYDGLDAPWPDTNQIFWDTSQPGVIALDESGTARPFSAGEVTIYAVGPDDLEDGVDVDVFEAELDGLTVEAVEAPDQPLTQGAQVRLQATAAFVTPAGSGEAPRETTQDVTAGATWVSSDRGYVVIDNAGPRTGVARVIAQPDGDPKTVTITAYYDQASETIELEIAAWAASAR